MARKSALVTFIFIAIIVMFAGCRGYGYRHSFAGGPHMDATPEWTFPLMVSHRPVPYTDLKKVYPPENNISTK
jgi:hypothetical protein